MHFTPQKIFYTTLSLFILLIWGKNYFSSNEAPEKTLSKNSLQKKQRTPSSLPSKATHKKKKPKTSFEISKIPKEVILESIPKKFRSEIDLKIKRKQGKKIITLAQFKGEDLYGVFFHWHQNDEQVALKSGHLPEFTSYKGNFDSFNDSEAREKITDSLKESAKIISISTPKKYWHYNGSQLVARVQYYVQSENLKNTHESREVWKLDPEDYSILEKSLAGRQ